MKELIERLRSFTEFDFSMDVKREAADALERLTAENQCLSDSCKAAKDMASDFVQLTADRDLWAKQAESVAEHNIKLTVENAALRADAERYRWMRRKGADWFSLVADNECENELDEKIDAVLVANAGEKK